MKKRIWGAALLAFLLMAMAACGGQSGNSGDSSPVASTQSGSSSGGAQSAKGDEPKEKIELRMAWWGGQERHDRTLQVIEIYESRNPHITIVPEYSGFEGYFEKLTTQFAAGNAPDIIQYGGNLNDFVARDVVLPLDDYVGRELDISKHQQSMIDAATFDGKFYGVTLGANAFGVLINKTLFEEANIPLPSREWTWEDMNEIGQKLTQSKDGLYGAMHFEQDGFGIFLAQRDKMLHEDGVIGFDEADVRDYFQLWKDMMDSGAVAPAEVQAEDSDTPEQSLMIQRRVAMDIVASNQFVAYSNASEDEFVLYVAPYDSSTGKHGVSPRPSQFLSGYSKTKHPEEVAKFLDFFVNDPEATAILGNERGTPINGDVLKHLINSANEMDKEIFSFMDWIGETSDAPYVPNLPGYNETFALFDRAVESIGFGRMSVEEAAREYYAETVKVLEKYKNE